MTLSSFFKRFFKKSSEITVPEEDIHIIEIQEKEEDFLLHIIKNILPEMKVNEYDKGHAGTLKIAEDYIKNTEGYSFEREDEDKLNIFYDEEPIGYIRGQIPSTNDVSANILCQNKYEAEKLLKENNINTTQSIRFKKDVYEFAKLFVESKDIPLVVKPNRLSGGRGITINVNSDNFDDAWKFAADACREEKKEIEIIIQPVVEGIESRFIVIDGKFESAVLRLPAHVIGDGNKTINELIEEKNAVRDLNPYLKRLPIKMDFQSEQILATQDYDFKTVLPDKEVAYLRLSSNLTQGGDNVEISHLVNESMKSVAENTVNAIPGLNTAGVDLLYTYFDDENPTVLEVNPSANLRMHHYPWKGQPSTPVYTLIESMKSTLKS